MNYDLVLNPLQIGNGMITRSEIMDMIISAGKNNQLDPLETLRFYREVEKAAGEAVKAIDPAYDKSIDKAAADFAETLPEVMAVLEDGKKEFPYKNCRYQYKENREAIDLSDSDEYEGKYAADWRKQNKEFKRLDKQIKELKADQLKCKRAMEVDAEQYVAKHPSFVVKTEHYIAVV